MDQSLLNGMHPAVEAGHSSRGGQGCMKGTRRNVLLELEEWLEDKHRWCVLWLNSALGTRKSAITQMFAETRFADRALGASLFCPLELGNRNNIQLVLPTLAFQLAHWYPRFREELLKLLTTNPDVAQEALDSQMEKLIIRPFEVTQIQTLIIIDGLDYCEDPKELHSAILVALSKRIDRIPNVRFFITACPESNVAGTFHLLPLYPINKMVILDQQHFMVINNIRLFLWTWLVDIGRQSLTILPENWPDRYNIEIVCKMTRRCFMPQHSSNISGPSPAFLLRGLTSSSPSHPTAPTKQYQRLISSGSWNNSSVRDTGITSEKASSGTFMLAGTDVD